MSMVWIAGQTVTTAQQVTFSSIPQNFTHLQVRVASRSTFNPGAAVDYQATLYLFFNGVRTLSYSRHSLYGDGVSVFSSNAINNADINIPALGGPFANQLANVYSSGIIDILDYTNIAKNKTIRAINGVDLNATVKGSVAFSSGTYYNTQTINSIDLHTDGSFAIGSRFDLYGISTSSVTGE